jgi:hypothetical protein
MKTLIKKNRYFRSALNKVLIALVFVTSTGMLSPQSAFADRDDGGYGGYGNRGWHGDHDGRGYGDRDDYRRGYGGGYGGYGGYRPVYPQPYSYSQPVYVPPPVYVPRPMYMPQQAPGINLVFPLNFR